MGLHLCPIEPPDWSDGPNEPELDECRDCNGTGTIDADRPDCHDAEMTCPKCGGDGYVAPPEYDDGDDR
jgi:DnaJ-class molecular chaperone